MFVSASRYVSLLRAFAQSHPSRAFYAAGLGDAIIIFVIAALAAVILG